MLGGDARPYRHSIVSNSRKIQSGSDSDRLSANEILAARQRLKGMGIDTAPMSDDDIQKIALDRARVSRRGADHGRRRGEDHSRWRQGRALAHPGRRRRPQARRAGAADAGTRLHAGVLSELCRGGRLAAGINSHPRDARTRTRRSPRVLGDGGSGEAGSLGNRAGLRAACCRKNKNPRRRAC